MRVRVLETGSSHRLQPNDVMQRAIKYISSMTVSMGPHICMVSAGKLYLPGTYQRGFTAFMKRKKKKILSIAFL